MEQQLKQRLTGAIVIVSLAVIFIPVILEGPRDEWTPRDHTIPEPPELAYNAPPELPLPAAPATPPVADVGETPVAVPPAVVPPPPPPPEPAPQPEAEAAPSAPAAAPPAPAPTPAGAPASAALAGGWYVQVGSFSQQANARGERDRLAGTGLDAHVQTSVTGEGAVYRVLIGPEKSRELAEQQKAKLAATQKTGGIVIEVPAGGGG